MKDEAAVKAVRVRSRSAITPLGFGMEENLKGLREGSSALHWVEDPEVAPEPFYGGLLDRERVASEFPGEVSEHPFFEQVAILAAQRAIEEAGVDPEDPELLFVIATTKGNVELLAEGKRDREKGREYLHTAASSISGFLGNPNTPWVVSNACVSGVLAIDVAADLIRADHIRRAVVIGADVLTPFVVSGFQAFMALGSSPCRPYDSGRDGLSLGEAAAAMVLEKGAEGDGVFVLNGASSNDANHISGPSRDGGGLALSIEKVLKGSGLDGGSVPHLNAHGTATSYNDEMEAKAFHRCGLSDVPMNSYKGILGHSLGAAGMVESVFSLEALERDELFPSVGYRDHGVSLPLNLIREGRKAEMGHVLKTASGFGGCNAAILFEKG